MAAKIEVKNLTISFRTNNGAVRAVRDISFSLEQGETLAIAGESGSGKSVTTKAIMGISAPNAVVENGEIIYDGRDLLKIDEEDFHTLRGHKLSMVFQDPLSALNPVMRIGKQLTEAMILNNRERRRDGRRSYYGMMDRLRTLSEPENISGKPDGTLMSAVRKNFPMHAGKDDEARLFDAFEANVKAATPCRIAYDDARRATQEMRMFISEVNDDVLKSADGATMSEAVGRLLDALRNTENEYMFSRTDIDAYSVVLKDAVSDKDSIDYDSIKQTLVRLEENVNDALAAPAPDFYALAGGLEEEQFRAVIAKALRRSATESVSEKKRALKDLEVGRAIFAKQNYKDRGVCKDAANILSKAVSKAIDRTRLQKDNGSYVFSSSMKTNIRRYFDGIKRNPKEHARFIRETKQYEQCLAEGKEVHEVVPEFCVDLDTTRRNILRSIDDLVREYKNAEYTEDDESLNRRAGEMVDYLRTAYYDSRYRMPKWVARNRAISLMKEVGIPEPYKRYTQYPFEFSGGMRQRIVIAIALSANPDVLICDEPTTALDVTIQAQILELINRLKAERNLTVIFITHDLGVVANMADKIAIMYAGKIVEYGTDEDVFYDPRHPYTWALLSSMPDLETKEKLEAIPGTPPDMIFPPKGDAFAERNRYAMQIDYEQQPPRFDISPTHWAATWLLHPNAPHIDPPAIVTERIKRMKSKVYDNADGKGQEA